MNMEQKQYQQQPDDAFNDYLDQLNADLDEIEEEKRSGHFRSVNSNANDDTNAIIIIGIFIVALLTFLMLFDAAFSSGTSENEFVVFEDDPVVEVIDGNGFVYSDEDIIAFRNAFDTLMNAPLQIDGSAYTWDTSLKDLNTDGWSETEYDNDSFDMQKHGYHMQVTFEDYTLSRISDVYIYDEDLPVSMPLGITKGMSGEEVLEKFREAGLEEFVTEGEYEHGIHLSFSDEDSDKYLDYAIQLEDDCVVSGNLSAADGSDFYNFTYND